MGRRTNPVLQDTSGYTQGSNKNTNFLDLNIKIENFKIHIKIHINIIINWKSHKKGSNKPHAKSSIETI